MPCYHNSRFAFPTTKESEKGEASLTTKPPKVKTKTNPKAEAGHVLHHPRSPAATIVLRKRVIMMASTPTPTRYMLVTNLLHYYCITKHYFYLRLHTCSKNVY